eukprot:5817492-Pleurochrysis_carterae.AAC.1
MLTSRDVLLAGWLYKIAHFRAPCCIAAPIFGRRRMGAVGVCCCAALASTTPFCVWWRENWGGRAAA